MKYIFCFLSSILFICNVSSQTTIKVDNGCFYDESNKSNEILIIKPKSNFYPNMASEILLSVGIKKTVLFYEAAIDNALATIYNGQLLIIYDPIFLQSMEKISGNQGGSKLVLAHEIGHLLNLHSISPSSSSPWWDELDADYFAGSVAYAQNIPIETVYKCAEIYPTISYSSTHPHRNSRIKTMINGYCNEQYKKVQNGPISISNPSQRIISLKSQLISLLNSSIINFDYDKTIKYYFEQNTLVREWKDSDQKIMRDRILISDINSIELRPHDVGIISFNTYSNEMWWGLGGIKSKSVLSNNLNFDDLETDKEGYQLLKQITLILGELKFLTK